jgi:hypothetical protein
MNANITSESLRLDGNAAAGMLSEVFVSEPTVALSTCAGCGATAMMGALLVYTHGMGTVMRCPACDGIILRVARTEGRLWLDATGAKCIVLPTGTNA